MNMTARFPTTQEEDAAAIETLNARFARSRAAFLKDQYPDAEARIDRVLKLRDMFKRYRHDIAKAMDTDYGNHPTQASDLFEVGGMIGRAEYAAKHLKQWMKPDNRKLNPLLGGSKGYIRHEPKGVIGNMSPWNFPFEIACGPLVEALAAGNRAIIKPSEVTPTCAMLLEHMIAETFDEDMVTTAIGGIPLAEHFSTLRWDHLIYTGNSAIARRVMVNAARNLVPVTLELGGKSPAILDSTRIDATAARYIIGMKGTKRGQVCVNVDYCMVPEADLDRFIALLKADLENGMVENNAADHSAAIVSDRHHDRQLQLIAEAEAAGAKVITLGTRDYDGHRNVPFTLVIDPPLDIELMQKEIFGPILPIVTYKTLDAALDFVNAGECPLGLYVFSEDRAVIDKVLDNTRSGGASVNCAGGQVQHEMGFGGVGESGMGRHHGPEGFYEFSNPRGIMELKHAPGFEAIIPPYGKKTDELIGAIFGGTGTQVKFGLKLVSRNIMARLRG